MTAPELDAIRDADTGELPAYAWPGGYLITYFTRDGMMVCADCANRETDEAQAAISFDYECGDEDEDCEDCGRPMEPSDRAEATSKIAGITSA